MAKHSGIYQVIPQLSDLELLLLICLIADNHCVVRAPEEELNQVESDLETISHSLFGYSSAVVKCTSDTTLEDLSNAVLEESDEEKTPNVSASAVPFKSARPRDLRRTITLDDRKTCNVIIVRDLDQTERNVQIQALELMRSRRIYTKTAVHATPKRFLFVALLPDTCPGPPYLTPHLNDLFFVSHLYASLAPESSQLNSKQGSAATSFRASSVSHKSSITSINSAHSVVRRPSPLKRTSFNATPNYRNPNPPITDADIVNLAELASKIRPSATIHRHIHNIPTHLRLHRHVKGGVSAVSTRHLNLLSRILAVLQMAPESNGAGQLVDLDGTRRAAPVITPTLVSLAATKVYTHRIEIVHKVEDERSMQWGSDHDAVARTLKTASVDRCIEETIVGLEVPA